MVDILINIHKIKFAVLDEIIKLDEDSDCVNFYIDMHTIMSKFYKKNNNSDIINYNNDAYVALMSSMFNLIAHYRRYFYKRQKSNRIFIVWDSKIPTYQASLIPFGQTYFDRYSPMNDSYKEINHIFKELFKSLKSLTRYFKGVYFIETEGIDDVTKIQYLINKYDGQNIIYSKYDYFSQLVVNNNTQIIFPKRDDSYMITRENLFDSILSEVKYKAKEIDYRIFPIYMMINGMKCRDVPSMNIGGKVKLVKLLDVMIDAGHITNDVSVQSFIKYFAQLCNGTEDNNSLLVKRYQALNAKVNTKALSNSQINQIEHCIVDLYDDNSIEKINDNLEVKFHVNYLDLYKSDYVKLRKKEWN